MRASYLFLVTAVAVILGAALAVGPSVLNILLGIKRGGQVAIAPYLTVPTRWLAWTLCTVGVIVLCVFVTLTFFVLRKAEEDRSNVRNDMKRRDLL